MSQDSSNRSVGYIESKAISIWLLGGQEMCITTVSTVISSPTGLNQCMPHIPCDINLPFIFLLKFN